MIPLNMETEDGTIFVNSKQYHGIIRRRQSRAKAAAVLDRNKMSSRCRKVLITCIQKLFWYFRCKWIPINVCLMLCMSQPYMHHSRHLHALRRPRGSGGRFLNTKSQSNTMEKSGTNAKKADGSKQIQSQPKPQQSNSQNSEVVHPENGTMNLSNGLNVSGTEVTSINYFLSSPVHSLGGMVMPSKWIAAAMDNDCCNFKNWSFTVVSQSNG